MNRIIASYNFTQDSHLRKLYVDIEAPSALPSHPQPEMAYNVLGLRTGPSTTFR